MTFDTLPAIWLAPEDRARARQRIEQALHGSPAGAAMSWLCPSCLETIEAQFTECWSCGAERPSSGPDN